MHKRKKGPKKGVMPPALKKYWAKRKKSHEKFRGKGTFGKPNHKSSKRKRKVNPTPLLFVITAKGSGKKMHYDGSKFSERARVVTFKTADAAAKKAYELVAKYPVLRRYSVAVESNAGK